MKLAIDDTKTGKRKTFKSEKSVKSITAKVTGTKEVDQVGLFWFGNPHLIMAATQYMQFGYALGLAVIFTYWKDFHSNYAPINTDWFLLVLLISYCIFLHLVAEIIPW